MNQAAIAVALAVITTSAGAQQPTPAAEATPEPAAKVALEPAAEATPEPAAKATLEPAAMAALHSMGAYLRTLKAFQVEAATTDEDVLDDGEKIQYAGVTNILAQMPGRLRAEVSNDRRERLYLYDGKSFTLFAKRAHLYATVPAPPTVGQLANKLDEDYGFTVPLADLFRWGSPGWSTDGITAATDVGPSAVEETTCEQYAFRQEDIDWQIWIQKGDYPLPRKLVITTKTDDARPQHTAVFTWNLAPSFNDETFTFDPPADAGKVVLAEIKPVAGATK
jgi:hypothetical protein